MSSKKRKYSYRAFDRQAKKVLAQKVFLARIVRRVAVEYDGVSVKDIETKYIEGTPYYGDCPSKRSDYDLLSVAMIYLGEEEPKDDETLRMLWMLFKTDITAQEPTRTLKEEFAIDLLPHVEEKLRDMCNLSEYVFERGEAKGLAGGRAEGEATGMVKAFILAAKSLMQKVGCSVTQAMETLQVPHVLQPTVMAAL